jgi:hypothetical protein
MPNYLLRDVPEDLWRKVKAAAALKGESVRELLIRLLLAETKTAPKR